MSFVEDHTIPTLELIFFFVTLQFLIRVGLECDDLEKISVKDQTLTNDCEYTLTLCFLQFWLVVSTCLYCMRRSYCHILLEIKEKVIC